MKQNTREYIYIYIQIWWEWNKRQIRNKIRGKMCNEIKCAVQENSGSIPPILDLRRLNFSLYKGKFKMLTMKTIMSQVQEGDWFVTIDLKDAYFHIQVVQDTGGSFGLPLEGRLTNTRSCPSAWLWPRERLRNAWMLHWPLWGSRAFVYWTIWMTGSFWLTPGS